MVLKVTQFHRKVVAATVCALIAVGLAGCSAPRSPKYEQLARKQKEPKPSPADAKVQKTKDELKEDPYSADKHFKLAKTYLEQGKVQDAINEFQTTLRINRRHTDAMLALAQIALAVKQYEDVKLLTDQVLEIKPRSAEAHQLRAVSFQQRGLLEDAVKAWRSALEFASSPQIDLAARRELVELYITQGAAQRNVQSKRAKYEAGLKLCDASLAKYPKAPYFLIAKGDFLGKLGNRKDAIAAYDKALQVDPKSAALRLKIAELYLSRGIEPERALKLSQEAVKLAPKDARVHAMLGRVHLAQGRSEKALTALRQAQKLQKGAVNPVLSNLIVAALLQKNQTAEAERELEAVVKASPKNAGPLVTLAGFYVGQRRYKEAVEQYQKALELKPDIAEVQFQLGQVYLLMDDRANAIRAYEAGLKLEPDAVLAANNLAYLYAQEKMHLSEALRLAEKASKATQEPPAILDTLGFVHYQREDYDSALKYLTRARDKMKATMAQNPKLQLQPNPTILYHLALAYQKKGKRQEAIAELEESLRIGRTLKERGGEFEEQKEAERLLQELKGS